MSHAIFKRFSVLVAVLILCAGVQLSATQDAHAQDAQLSSAGSSNSSLDKQFGVGVALGTVIGPTLQVRFGEAHAIDVVFGGSWNRGRHMHLHVQYIYKFNLKEWDAGRLSLHVGGGIEYSHYRFGRLRIAGKDCETIFGTRVCAGGVTGKNWLGIRVPVGVSFGFTKAPVDVYTEFAPGMYFIDKPDFSWTYLIGARYWF